MLAATVARISPRLLSVMRGTLLARLGLPHLSPLGWVRRNHRAFAWARSPTPDVAQRAQAGWEPACPRTRRIAVLLTHVLRRQDGVITYAQALECGLSGRQIEHRKATGSWLRVGPQVYFTADRVFGDRARLRTAVYSAGTGAAADGLASRVVARAGGPASGDSDSDCAAGSSADKSG